MLIVGAAIIDRGELLACRRTSPAQLAGQYEFPGGKVEPDEDPRSALVREIYEELEVRVTCEAEPIGSFPLEGTDQLVIYRATLDSARPTSSTDHDELRWLSPNEWLDGVNWIPVDRNAVALLQRQSHGEQSGKGQQ